MEKIIQHIFTQRSDIRLCETPSGLRLTMRNAKIEGEPGSPAFPVKKIRLALPPGNRPVRLKVEIVEQTILTRNKAFVTCIQPPRKPFSINQRLQSREDSFFVRPDEKRYQDAIEGLTDVAVMGKALHIGVLPVVPIDVSPIRYQRDGTLVLLEHLVLHLNYEEDTVTWIKPPITSRQRYQEHSMVHELVINPQLIRNTKLKLQKLETITELLPSPILIAEKIPVAGKSVAVPKQVDYLIVTDDQKWNPATLTATGAAGNLTAEFQRLAAHKKARGYRTHVAKVTDIVADRYGNFRTGARDLQEVIRNFLKNFVAQKGVEWVLLGGDISIIPHRIACGCAWGQIGTTDNLDEQNRAQWKGTYLGMRVDPGVFGSSGHLLTNLRTGELIPYDASGTSNSTAAGWYHTTSSSFATRTASKTEWIKVNGPSALTNDTLIWYTPTNLIPTDLYYSSLFSTYYSKPGQHDWDRLNNGIHGLYGQHNETDIHLGGIDFKTDVGLGRAPVETTDQAKIFVDKTITYDLWGEEHIATDYNRFKKMLYVADHWGYKKTLSLQSGNSMPPANGKYAKNAASGYALLHEESLDDENAGHKIICNYSDTARKVLSYNVHAGASHPGWYYAKSANDLTPSYKTLHIIFFTIDIPVPTPWVVVYGPPADISPMSFDIDRDETDSSVTQQEELRDWMDSHFSGINQVQRLYSDVTDMPAGSLSGAGLKRLTSENLEEELNDGPHFVSLTGHGNSGWVAHLSHDLINRLVNGEKTFIAIADSCLTNQFDENDAIGESLLYHAQGGAVAYIGNSRYSWIGVGDDFRLQFFKTMSSTRNLARLNDSRCLFRNDTNWRRYKLWTILEQTLMGDPELNVYRSDEDAYPRFIGNHNTMELHHSTCQWVKKMASYNKRFYNSIEEGLNLGYDGCAFCLKAYNHG